jgi:hypothetical protein
MEKFLDKISLVLSGAGITYGVLHLITGSLWYGSAFMLTGVLLLFAGMTSGKKNK